MHGKFINLRMLGGKRLLKDQDVTCLFKLV